MTCGNERFAHHDFFFRRGDSAIMTARFRTISEEKETELLDLSESIMTLFIEWPGGSILRSSADGGLVVDIDEGTVTWNATPQETKNIPSGRIAAYSMAREVQGGERRTLLSGFMVGIGVIDEGVSENV